MAMFPHGSPEFISQAVRVQSAREAKGQKLEHGFKLAFLGGNRDDDSVGFAPLRIHDYRYGVSADAICLRHCVMTDEAQHIHRSPAEACSCGFWALVVRSQLLTNDTYSWIQTQALAKLACVLEVDLYGKVIDGEIGFRAEHIEVLSVSVPRHCWLCDGLADGVKLNPFETELGLQQFYLPSCANPGCIIGELRTLEWLRQQLGTQISWEAAASIIR